MERSSGSNQSRQIHEDHIVLGILLVLQDQSNRIVPLKLFEICFVDGLVVWDCNIDLLGSGPGDRDGGLCPYVIVERTI